MIRVRSVPVFDDNYVWVLAADDHSPAVVVDPGDAGPVARALAAAGRTLAAVVLTHHHADHTGGAAELARRGASCPVFGPGNEDIAAVDHPLADGDTLEVAGLRFRVMAVPGHTRGHLAYVGHGLVLAGDTLFTGGCGRVFEGTPTQMWRSLVRLAALPAATALYCGHEYTVANLRFALQVEPGNRRLAERLETAAALRRRGEPTVPSTIAEERATNPFLRASEPEVRAAARSWTGRPVSDDAEVFMAIRAAKDAWRG